MPLRLFCIVAAMLLSVAAPAYGAGANCKFKAAGTWTLNFTLNPSVPLNVTANASTGTIDADKWGDCNVASMYMTASAASGASPRMTNGSAFIPYSLMLPASVSNPGNGVFYTFTLSGTVLWTDFANVPAGSYSDTVQITVNP